MHSFMLVRHGHVVAEGWWSPYDAKTRHSMYSLSKSFTSTAVGLAVAEGKLSVDDAVLKFFPDDAPAEPSANLKAMRVSDLLRMSTGQHAEDMAKFNFDSPEPLVKSFLAIPVAHKPGTHFWYNTPATFMCSAIVQKTTGQTVLDYLQAAPVRSARHRRSDLGNEARHLVRRLGPGDSHGRHREVRPALSAEGQMERQATRAGGVD